MRFESVRLIHAQGVPNNYTYNQVYVPTDEDHQKRGIFIILLSQTNTRDGHFLASLVNTLIREYYRQHSADLLTDFEQALIRLNSQIQSYRTTRDEAGGFEINGSVVLFTQDEIHLSHIGNPVAYLSREDTVIKLVEDKDTSASSGDNTFSVLTSGEVKPNDILALVTPLKDNRTIEEDLTFSFKQIPLFESGRGFARILKQKVERDVEAMFVRFNDTDVSAQHIYIDRSLESLSEKLETYQKGFAKHSAFVFEGGKFVFEKSKQIKSVRPKEMPSALDTAANESQAITEVITEEEPIDTNQKPVKDDSSPVTSLDEAILPPEEHTNNPTEEESEYRVRHYWQKDEPSAVAPAHKSANLEDVYEEQDASQPHHHVTLMPKAVLGNLKFKPRTLYMLIGCFFLLFIIVKTVNSVTKKTATPEAPKQTAAERDAIIEQANASFRKGESAQVQDNTATAMAEFATVLETLQTINEKNQNEASKALGVRAESALKTLTKTTEITSATKSQNLSGVPSLVVATSNGSIVVNSDKTIQRYTGDTVTSITNPAQSDVIAATSFDEGKKVALYAKDQTVYVIDTANGSIKQVTRSDGQAWPKSNLVAGYQGNLYFIGDTMFKATSKDDKFRVLPYNADTNTSTITSIVNNSANATFYAVENKTALARIVTNAPKTAIAISGLPQSMLPKQIARIITTPKDGLLYLLDKDTQRILVFNADGGYRNQYALPTDSKFIDCDIADTNLICVSESKQAKTFPLQ